MITKKQAEKYKKGVPEEIVTLIDSYPLLDFIEYNIIDSHGIFYSVWRIDCQIYQADENILPELEFPYTPPYNLLDQRDIQCFCGKNLTNIPNIRVSLVKKLFDKLPDPYEKSLCLSIENSSKKTSWEVALTEDVYLCSEKCLSKFKTEALFLLGEHIA